MGAGKSKLLRGSLRKLYGGNNVRLGYFLFVLLLGGCSHGAAEFQSYRQAYEAQYVEAAKVLDQVATAERIIVERSFKSQPGVRAFNPDEARYYIAVGDPPLTGAIRASVDALKDYNDALSGLVTGEAAATLRSELAAANNALAGSLGALAGASGVDAAFATALGGAIGKAIPVLEVLERAGNRIAFREQLVRAYPAMKQLMLELRDGTPQMFEVVERSFVTPGSLGLGPTRMTADKQARLAEFRQLLAGWVLLIDESVRAMDMAVYAAATQAYSPDLSSLIEASVEIRVLSEAIKAAR